MVLAFGCDQFETNRSGQWPWPKGGTEVLNPVEEDRVDRPFLITSAGKSFAGDIGQWLAVGEDCSHWYALCQVKESAEVGWFLSANELFCLNFDERERGLGCEGLLTVIIGIFRFLVLSEHFVGVKHSIEVLEEFDRRHIIDIPRIKPFEQQGVRVK